ncbi:hypothetical protein C8R47DRAFT_1079886 [Mycena vitilis]|nr:hypothetical protein C8R47DRAFT_1079886 [Mycena vitilis]
MSTKAASTSKDVSSTKAKPSRPKRSLLTAYSLSNEEKARRHRKAQADYRARFASSNPHVREFERTRAIERSVALKLYRRRWDPPKGGQVVLEPAVDLSEPSGERSELEVSDAHSFRDPRALYDLSFEPGLARDDSEEPEAGTSNAPTPQERLACSALAELARGVALSALDEDRGTWGDVQHEGVGDRGAIVPDAPESWASGVNGTNLHFPPDFALGEGPISVAAKGGKLPAGATPLSRVQELKRQFTGQVEHLTPVQTAQIWVAELNAGTLTEPSAEDKMEWTAAVATSWDFITYNQGCSIRGWRLNVVKAARAARRAGQRADLGMEECEASICAASINVGLLTSTISQEDPM